MTVLVARVSLVVACNVAMVAVWETGHHSWFEQFMAACGVMLVWLVVFTIRNRFLRRVRRDEQGQRTRVTVPDARRRGLTFAWFVASLIGAAFINGIWQGAFALYEVNLLILWIELRTWLTRRDAASAQLATEAFS